jgi:hypothetical protein
VRKLFDECTPVSLLVERSYLCERWNGFPW